MAQQLKKAFVLFCMFAFLLATAAIGFAFLLSPALHRAPNPWVHVTNFASLPDDGIPRPFQMFTEQQDAWTKLPDRPVGSVFLRRLPGSDNIAALDVMTPFGTGLTFENRAGLFTEPCWGMKYAVNGLCLNEPPNPGNIRRLDVQIREGTIFVIPLDGLYTQTDD